MYSVRLVTDSDKEAWDNFASAHKEASFFHTFTWGKILENGGVGKQTYFVLEKNQTMGIFPSFVVYRPLRNLRCLPLSDYGSPLLNHAPDTADSLPYLLKNVECESIKNLCLYSSLRLPSSSFLVKFMPKNYQRKLSSLGIRLDTRAKDINYIWKKQLSKKRRNSIKKAMKMDLEIKQGDTLRDFLSYYKLFVSMAIRRKVPPTHFKIYKSIFRSIYDNLFANDDYLLLLAQYQGNQVAGALAFSFKGGLYLWGNVSYEKYWHLKPNDLLYWYLIQYACEKNYEFIDFGPSSLTKDGTYLFKTQFGGKPFEIYDYYYSPFPFLLKLKDTFINLIKK